MTPEIAQILANGFQNGMLFLGVALGAGVMFGRIFGGRP